jgi:cell division transport system permease protein
MLAITSLVVLLIIISMRMASKREEMEILTLIGATRGFISSPIIMEAVIYAILGVVVGWLISFILILYSAPTIVSYFGEVPVLPSGILGLSKLFGIILVVELFFGLFLAFAGSLLAIGRVKKAR